MRRATSLWRFLAALAAAWAMSPSRAEDSRIRSVVYDPSDVVTLEAAAGYALVLELSGEERIDNIVVGDSGGWQVSPTKRGDRVVIKPSAGARATNMIVSTDVRRYVFTLQPAHDPGAAPFVVRFTYPQHAAAPTSVVTLAARYSLRGAKPLFPVLMTDDGRQTTIRWNDDTPLPAISATTNEGREAIVNGRMVNGDYVIEGVASRYIFRRDKAQAVATRRLMKAN